MKSRCAQVVKDFMKEQKVKEIIFTNASDEAIDYNQEKNDFAKTKVLTLN